MDYRNAVLAAGLALFMTAAGAQAQQAAKPAQAPAKGVSLMHATAPIADIDRAVAFYTKGLGMTVTQKIESPSVIEIFLALPGGGPGVILLKPGAGTAIPPHTTLTRLILSTTDLKATEAQLTAAGYKLSQPIRELPQYKVAVAHLDDPDGNHIEMIQPLP